MEEDSRERTLWVGNLSSDTSADLLTELFLQSGPLECPVKLVAGKDGRNGYAFVTFKHEESVLYACKLFRGQRLCGSELLVKPRQGSSHERQWQEILPAERLADRQRADQAAWESRNAGRHRQHQHHHQQHHRQPPQPPMPPPLPPKMPLLPPPLPPPPPPQGHQQRHQQQIGDFRLPLPPPIGHHHQHQHRQHHQQHQQQQHHQHQHHHRQQQQQQQQHQSRHQHREGMKRSNSDSGFHHQFSGRNKQARF